MLIALSQILLFIIFYLFIYFLFIYFYLFINNSLFLISAKDMYLFSFKLLT